ncbi:hypothetical protein [Roseovarius pelagicus]|uniref:GDSL-like Lipase/Acylhydrolase family protein n=1 Tax=Roseovarius pelagicus TaxID=2980108 RepID=A0ABY6DKD4_9RHOB|nr:hypothetical protein [Roseovarius pelagicus]UXX84230.1 hypothetical protein N7U68_06150 [Roseovarius pelagicus]
MHPFLRVAKTTALILFSTFAALLLFVALDVAYTLATGQDTEALPYDRQAGGWYQLRANFSGHDQFGGAQYTVYTDADGYRAGPPDARRTGPATTIFLGDSFTYGVNGPWDETFVGMYAQATPDPVINAGVSSYSPTAYLHRYGAALRQGRLAPQHRVVIGLDVSDVQDEAAIWTDGPDGPVRYSHLEKSALDLWFDRTFPKGLAMWGMVEKGLKTLKGPDGDGDVGTVAGAMAAIDRSAFTFRDWQTLDARAYAPLGVAGGLTRIETKLSELSALARQNGGDVWLLVYPWPAQLVHDSTELRWPDHVRTLCARIACNGVIDTFPAFRTAQDAGDDWYDTLFLQGDVHYAKAGNRLIFEALQKTLDR